MGLPTRFQANHLHAIAHRLFMAAGTPHPIADFVAEILVNANLAGHDSHGVQFLPMYLDRIENGGITPAVEPAIAKETATTLLVDGKGGFGHYTTRQALYWAIEKAKESNVCCVNFTGLTHIGRLGEYAELAVAADCMVILTSGGGSKNSGNVTPFGGAQPALSTNPIAVGVPTGDDAPFILDFATSIVAGAKVRVALNKGVDVPEGWIVDKHGKPTTNPADFDDGGYLLPFGGHKGYALALLVCLLGGLSGKFDPARASMGGAFLQVINIDSFTPLEGYKRGVRAFLDGLRSTPPAPGFDSVQVPGDFERRSRRERLAQGIEVPDPVCKQIEDWADKLDVSLSEAEREAGSIDRYQATS